MVLKKLGVALVVVIGLGAVTASSAFAIATTTVEPWRTGTSPTTTTVLTGSQAVTAKGSGEFVSELATTPIKFKWTEVACVSCTVFNESGGAKSAGKLELRNVSMVTPSTCMISNPILTSSLKGDWTYMVATTAYAQFTASPVFTFTLTGTPCPDGTYEVTGSLFGKLVNATGVYATGQELSFSQAINEAAGGILKLGSKAASITGTARFEAAGKFFGVE